ncbi:hypothetical protein FOCG_11457 [Fusarium oxysporum f. sp. radicis-lycopersici 26381]|uniref:Uncharacterized protein n=1 Tax=Fusarium oxysporum Fo47 TaxID=660027 RepID=W9KV51_FUSOX|nr:hypothetical protein FOZG_02747 [Fusarium oxysporum Fo47]EWZ84657.1 hypothetical protein FOWG_12410 [Fusarium oxysporum f. sp. lycopersici MN25]EXL47243.1 hypothetical protein FOCG_11457 [Fusarium oxysporum f. sp. radicis-lycopersici 26381]EWZ46649.1 hypothetical protein FOZG_02747 [Fusarium oxysporum Fo47]EWZ84658.1 hypothetical protein FOWG_12410 [Fusarium oxysporum f. sp. lycopersici MN25]
MNIVAHSYDVRTSNSSALISYRGPRGRFMLDLKRKIQLKGLTRHYQPLQLKRYFGHKLCATEKSGTEFSYTTTESPSTKTDDSRGITGRFFRTWRLLKSSN